MARTAALMDDDEDDIPMGGGQSRPAARDVDIPAGLSGSHPGDTPRPRDGDAEIPLEFDMVDDEQMDLAEQGDDAGVRQEDDEADRGQRQNHRSTGAERRKAQRQARDRESQRLRELGEENARLRAEMEDFRATVMPRFEQIDQSRKAEEVSAVDREIQEAAQTVQRAIRKISEAMSSGDVEAHEAAMIEHNQALLKGQKLELKRDQLQRQATAPTERAPNQEARDRAPPQRAEARPDPVVQARTEEFTGRLPWINIGAPDRDTRVALIIDAEVAADGFNPRNQDYWDELDARLREAPQLAHRFRATEGRQPPPRRQETQQPAAERRGPMVGAPGGATSGSGTRRVRMSPDRKAAMIQAGVLDTDGKTILNPGKFNRIAAGYVEYDRQLDQAAR